MHDVSRDKRDEARTDRGERGEDLPDGAEIPADRRDKLRSSRSIPSLLATQLRPRASLGEVRAS
jgi:hypothetical protein